MTKVGILGSAVVGQTLAQGFKQHGYEVRIGSRTPAKLASFTESSGIPAGTFEAVGAWGELLVLAVHGMAAQEVLTLAGAKNHRGKIVIDTTNPLTRDPPVDGVVKVFTGPNESLLERLQAEKDLTYLFISHDLRAVRHLSDRVGRKQILVGSMLATAVVLAAMAFSGGSPLFIALVAVLGFFLYATRPVIQAWLLEATPRNMAGSSIGVLFGAQAVGAAIGPLLGGLVADRWGLLATFYFLAATIVIANLFVVPVRKALPA